MIKPHTVELYRDTAGEHRWRLKAPNGKIIADSGEGYAKKSGGLRAAKKFAAMIKASGPTQLVVDGIKFAA